MTAFLMPFPRGKALVSQRSLSQPQHWPFQGHGQGNPRTFVLLCSEQILRVCLMAVGFVVQELSLVS